MAIATVGESGDRVSAAFEGSTRGRLTRRLGAAVEVAEAGDRLVTAAGGAS